MEGREEKRRKRTKKSETKNQQQNWNPPKTSNRNTHTNTLRSSPPPRIFLIFKSSRYEAHQRHWNVVTENATVKSDINDYNLTLPVALTRYTRLSGRHLNNPITYLHLLIYLTGFEWQDGIDTKRGWCQVMFEVLTISTFNWPFPRLSVLEQANEREEERERGDRQSGKHRQTDRQRYVGGRKGLSEVLTQRLSRISGWTENKTLFLQEDETLCNHGRC